MDTFSHRPLGKLSFWPNDYNRNWMWHSCITCRPRCVKLSWARTTCVQCGKGGDEAPLLLDATEVMASWVGRTWARCFTCSGFADAAMFEATAQGSWVQHDAAMWSAALRLQKLRNAMKVLQKWFPGASQWQLRTLTFKQREAAAMATATALDASEEFRRAADHVKKKYLEEIKAAAVNLTYRASRQGSLIESLETGYLTEVARGLTVSFLFRCTKCSFLGMQDQWIKQVDPENFQCPQCRKLHVPRLWTSLAQVLSMTDPSSGLFFCFPGDWPRLNNKRPDCEEARGWLTKQAELKARSVQEYIGNLAGEDLDAFVQKSVVSLSDLLARAAIPRGFMRLGCDRDVKVFNRWEEFIRLLANVVAGAKALSSRNLPSDYFGSAIK
jgi:hypothetical protein